MGFNAMTGISVRRAWRALFDTKTSFRQKHFRKHSRRRHTHRGRRALKISVIIPAHNEESYIGPTLQRLKQQQYHHFETIVVANGCTDRTAEEAVGLCDRLVVLSNKSLGVARNLGARLARGHLLVFLDADTWLEPSALSLIAKSFTPDCAAGTVKGAPDGKRLSYRLIYATKNLLHSSTLHAGSSGVILCWKRDFMAIHGFDEGLQVRENSELMRRLLKFGGYRYIGVTTAVTSMRRYQTKGTVRTVWLWFKVWLESHFGDIHQRCYDTVR